MCTYLIPVYLKLKYVINYNLNSRVYLFKSYRNVLIKKLFKDKIKLMKIIIYT